MQKETQTRQSSQQILTDGKLQLDVRDLRFHLHLLKRGAMTSEKVEMTRQEEERGQKFHKYANKVGQSQKGFTHRHGLVGKATQSQSCKKVPSMLRIPAAVSEQLSSEILG